MIALEPLAASVPDTLHPVSPLVIRSSCASR